MENLKRSAETDPDYEDISETVTKRMRLQEEINLKTHKEKVLQLIKQEFQNEVSSKEREVQFIQQRLLKAQKTLHLLKYVITKSFYDRKDLNLSTNEELCVQVPGSSGSIQQTLNTQNRIHPAIKRLIGKRPVKYEPYRTRTQSQKKFAKPIETDEETNVYIGTITKEPDDLPRNETKLVKSDGCPKLPIRNKDKTKYEIIVGNISKWMPPAPNSPDSTTHKWMVYVRGPRLNPDITHIVKKVRFFLHPSYQPNDIVEIEESPFHLSRRGWGEFPLRVQLHFHCSANKPVDIIHNIKLDRTYIGRQTIGNETVVNLWLYSNNVEEPEVSNMNIRGESNENQITVPINNVTEDFDPKPSCSKFIPEENYNSLDYSSINCNDFSITTDFNLPSDHMNYCVTNETDIKKKINQVLPMGENICIEDSNDSEPQITEELVFDDSHLRPISQLRKKKHSKHNSKHMFIKNGKPFLSKQRTKKKSVSLLKAMFKKKFKLLNKQLTDSDNNNKEESNEVLDELETKRDYDLIFLSDHCYTVYEKNSEKLITIDKEKYKIELPLNGFNSIRQTIYFLFKSLPLITELANDLSYKCCYPYAASDFKEYSSWSFAKRCCSEWFRAKLIKKLITSHNVPNHEDWSTKFLVMYGRAHAFTPLAIYDIFKRKDESGKTVPNRTNVTSMTSSLTEYMPIETIMNYKSRGKYQNDEDEFVDVENIIKEEKVCKISAEERISYEMFVDNNSLLPCTYVGDCAKKIEIDLEPEEIVPEIWYNASQRVILEALKCFAEEVIRKAWANNVIENRGRNLSDVVETNAVYNVLLERPEFDIFLNDCLGKCVKNPTNL